MEALRPRRWPIALAAGLCLGAFAWIAAPAQSVTSRPPAPGDFGQALPAARALSPVEQDAATPTRGEHAGDPVLYLSPPVEAPHEFDLVGVAGELRALEIRTRNADDGTWSEWMEIEGGDPVYSPGSDASQVRSRDFRPAGELHYVEVAEDSPAPGASAPADSGSVSTRGAVPPPTFISRGGWGADNASGGCRPRSGPAYGSVQAIAVHHTVSTVDYTQAQAPGIVLGICRYHVNGNGWNDIGYNALVDRFGTLYEGRAGGLEYPVVGAHTEGYNSQIAGIASIGNHDVAPISPAAQASLVRYLAWRLTAAKQLPGGTATLTSQGGDTNRYPRGGAVTVDRVFGHGTLDVTACPGSLLNAILPTIRKQVQGTVKRYTGGKKEKKKRKKKGHRGKKHPKKPKKPPKKKPKHPKKHPKRQRR